MKTDSTHPESTEERFLSHLERALKHLYDPAILRASPLIALFHTDQRADPVFALRDLLIHTIASLVPPANVPKDTRAWRVYQILQRRYTEQHSQKQVAVDLGLSVRQLQREERLARQVLAARLRADYGLDGRLENLPSVPVEAKEETDDAAPDALTRREELQQFDSAVPVQVTNLEEVIREVLEITRPLMQTHHVVAHTAIANDLPRVPLKTLLLRQALLEIVGAATRYADERIVIAADCVARVVSLRIGGRVVSGLAAQAARAGLEIAEQLIGLCGGVLRRATDSAASTFEIEIIFPLQDWLTVLVIDDNADARLLAQRYLEGKRYHVIGVADGRQGIKLAQELQPNVILLDIMMPEHDGWEILGQLRVHPRTRAIPVFVCTILAQEELALSLGAAQFIRKPINPATLLAALERHRPARQESD